MESSRLSQFPAELRNRIYEFALHEEHGVETWQEPGLLQTCKQIRYEAGQMFYAVNRFVAIEHEEHPSDSLCRWLDAKASKLSLIRGLTIQCEMPSLRNRKPGQETEEDDDESNADAFVHQLDIMEKLREAPFGRKISQAVNFTLNGATDAERFEKIAIMSPRDQDRYRSAKFLLLCLVYGQDTTLDAEEATDSQNRIEELDKEIRQDRTLWQMRTMAREIPL